MFLENISNKFGLVHQCSNLNGVWEQVVSLKIVLIHETLCSRCLNLLGIKVGWISSSAADRFVSHLRLNFFICFDLCFDIFPKWLSVESIIFKIFPKNARRCGEK